MKFQKLSAFEKHFKEALSHHLSAIYVVVCPSESERKKILFSLAAHLKGRTDFLRCERVEQAIGHLNALSLFSKETAALFDGVDQLVKGELKLLSTYCGSPRTESCLLLGSARLKEVDPLYRACKSDMVVLDLSKEKPWDEKERFFRWVGQTARLAKRQIHSDAAMALVERFPRDRLLLQQELNKLLCYVGDRVEITLADVSALCGSSIEHSSYQLAREIVWEGGGKGALTSDPARSIALIAAVRSQLEIGLKLCSMKARGAQKQEVEAAFPRLFPKALQQCMSGASQKGSRFFEEGLLALYDLELGVKSSRGRPDVLFAHFLCSLQSAPSISNFR